MRFFSFLKKVLFRRNDILKKIDLFYRKKTNPTELMRARFAAWLLQKRSKIRRLLLTARPILYALVKNRLKYIF